MNDLLYVGLKTEVDGKLEASHISIAQTTDNLDELEDSGFVHYEFLFDEIDLAGTDSLDNILFKFKVKLLDKITICTDIVYEGIILSWELKHLTIIEFIENSASMIISDGSNIEWEGFEGQSLSKNSYKLLEQSFFGGLSLFILVHLSLNAQSLFITQYL